MLKLSNAPTTWRWSSHSRRRAALLLLLFGVGAMTTFLLLTNSSTRGTKKLYKRGQNDAGHLRPLKEPIRQSRRILSENVSHIELHNVVLIDPEVLSCLGCQLPDRPIEFISFSNESSRSHLAIVHRAFDDPQKDFFTVEYGNETRAVVKFNMVPFEVDSRQFLVPEDVEHFLWSWGRSKFINCLGLDMGRKEKKDFREVAAGVARFRSLAATHRVTLVLNGGALLGWYRECSIIPHTSDLDFTINSEEHSANFMRAMETSEDFKLYHTYAEPSGCFQFKACLRGTKTKLDVFYLYRNSTTSWVCGSLDKFRVLWWYPPAMEFCTGELLGTLVYVPCAVEEHLEVNYGKTWREEVKSSHFNWVNSAANVLRKEKNEEGHRWRTRYVDRCDGYV